MLSVVIFERVSYCRVDDKNKKSDDRMSSIVIDCAFELRSRPLRFDSIADASSFFNTDSEPTVKATAFIATEYHTK